MRTYQDKAELKNEIDKSFEKYISEFDNIPESFSYVAETTLARSLNRSLYGSL